MAAARVFFAFLAVSSMCAIVVGACSKQPSFVNDVATGTGATSGAAGGTASGGGGAGHGGAGGGAGDECVTAADCPGEESECASRTCENGFCGMTFKPDGFAVVVQKSGDCVKNACDGKGNVVVQNDDADGPNDGNDCTTDICTRGVPSHGNEPAGKACGVASDLTCDGAGICKGCTTAPQCGMDSECLKYVCSSMNCIPAPVPEGGGNPPGQTDHDCKKVVCNGTGGVEVISDNSDTATDGDACTSDSCSNGVPSYSAIPPQDDFNPCTADACDSQSGATTHTPVGNGTSCGGCDVCLNGSCQSSCTGCDVCNGSSCVGTCSACETCNGSQCVSTCPGCQACQGGQCVGGCGPCQQCQGSQCVGGCGPCETCNGSNQCVSNCGPCEVCQGGQCQSQCGSCQSCVNNTCVNDCQACETCSGGSCVQNCGPCETCDGGGNCASTCDFNGCEACINGSCQFKCNGCAYCNGGGQCEIEPCCGDPCCGDPCCLNPNIIPCAAAPKE